MDLPTEVLIHNELLGFKNRKGTLIAVSPHGFFETKCKFGETNHRVLLPIAATVVIFRQPEPEFDEDFEIER